MAPDSRLPIVPHVDVADVDCCGCLIVEINGDNAAIMCNECGATIRTVPVGDVERVMASLAATATVCSARCTHCGAVNVFRGMSTVDVFICSECGEGVEVVTPMQ